jgi:hypothetical protein
MAKVGRRKSMWGGKAILIGFLGVLFLGGLVQAYAASDEPKERLRSVSGEIAFIDVKLGKLQLEGEETRSRRYPTEFRINLNDTRVTDPSDTKFLVIKDLKVGQHVTVEFDWIRGGWREPAMALKIIAEPMPEPVSQEATGEIEAIDVQAGTLIIEQKPLAREGGEGNLLYFVFEPNDIAVMKAPDVQPVQLDLKPGDIVKVEYVVRDGRRHARSITLISAAPKTTRTTTTTTTSTTVRTIIAEPLPEPDFQEATGELEAIDFSAGTFVLEQKPSAGEAGKANLFDFVFEPNYIVVMKAPNVLQPVLLDLKPGDIVKVEFAVKEGKRYARSITLISAAPETTSTTTTTTKTTVTR